ncbi:MAG TPA: ABC transporter ATP-binding protein, partial [Exilispira sp.]|nr:ABC transporter ATP-binding protein [Exilispira sp.]
LPNLMSDIVNKGVVKADTSYIFSVGLKMLFFSLLSVLFGVISHLTSARVAAAYARDLRTAIFKKVTNFSLEEFDKFSTSSLITRNTNDIVQIQQVTIMMMRMVIRAPVMGIGSIVMAFSLNMKLSEILFVSIPILIIGTILLITKTMPIFTNMQKKIDRINLVIRENLIGVRVIRAFNKEKHEESRFKEANEDLTKTALKVNRINALMFPLMSFIVNFTTIAVIFFGSKLIAMNELSIGNMMAVLQYVAQILFAFSIISMIFVFLPRAMASGKRLNEVLLTENSIVEPENPVKINSNISLQGYNNYTILKNTDSAIKNSDLKCNLSLNETDQDLKIKDIIFQNVSFSYPNSKELALEDISFKIPHKMTTAIIGSTGSGKTTILNLILRMYDVKNGKILIQDEDIRNYSLEDLHNFFGYAPQKPVIFNDTIFENIRFGRDISEDEVI